MIIYYHNYQDKLDPDHARAILSEDELSSLIERKRKARPFIAEFCGAGDFDMTVGVGGDYGCAQYSRVDGKPPYLMAMSHRPPMKRGVVEFFCGGTPTPIAARYILNTDELKIVLSDFLRTGERSAAVSWQVFNPKACKEDAERPRNS